MTMQQKFEDDIASFGRLLISQQRKGFDIRRGRQALAHAKTKQRQARAAVFAGRYRRAADLLDAAYVDLQKWCPPGAPECAALPIR